MNFVPNKFDHSSYRELVNALYREDWELAGNMKSAEKSGDVASQENVAALMAINTATLRKLQNGYGIYETLRQIMDNYYNNGVVDERIVKYGWDFRETAEGSARILHHIVTEMEEPAVRNSIATMAEDADSWLAATK